MRLRGKKLLKDSIATALCYWLAFSVFLALCIPWFILYKVMGNKIGRWLDRATEHVESKDLIKNYP